MVYSIIFHVLVYGETIKVLACRPGAHDMKLFLRTLAIILFHVGILAGILEMLKRFGMFS